MPSYFKAYRVGMKSKRYILRQDIVRYAREHGIKAAAQLCQCSRNTVRKWLRRYEPGKPSSLNEQSKRPKHCPHQTSAAIESKVLRLRRQSQFGAERLKMEFDLPCGISAIKRIIKGHGLARPRKRKHVTKQDLRDVKKQWKIFGQLSADTKYLQDIPHYWPFMYRLGLPHFQYTVREVVSGLTFIGYADELAKSFNVLMAERVSAHLAYYGLDLSQVEWQTDNGSENLEDTSQRGLPSLVRALGSRHHYIPPKAYTWQSDVETVHRLQEDEFFDLEDFSSKTDFWNKVTTYWLHFNIARRNRHKDWMSPFQILLQKRPDLHPGIASWRPLDLGKLHAHYTPVYNPKGGHDLPVHPCRKSGRPTLRDSPRRTEPPARSRP
jgi:transposase